MTIKSRSNLVGFEALESKRMFTANPGFVPIDPTVQVDQTSDGVIILGDYLEIRGSRSEGIRGSGSEGLHGLMSTGIPIPAVSEAQPNGLQDIIAILGTQTPRADQVDAVIGVFDA